MIKKFLILLVIAFIAFLPIPFIFEHSGFASGIYITGVIIALASAARLMFGRIGDHNAN